jgi:hypothetical protein
MRGWLWTWLTVDETFLEYTGRLSVGISGEKSALNGTISRHWTHIARPAVITAHFGNRALFAGFYDSSFMLGDELSVCMD